MKVLLSLILGLCCCLCKAWAQDYEVLNQIDELTRLSGIVMVVGSGQVLHQQSFGYADHQSRQPIDEHTPFPLASLTKPFTALAIEMLHKQGRLELDDRVATYLPAFSNKSDLTIRHLIEHRSGLPRDLTDTPAVSPYLPIDPSTLVALIAEAPTTGNPGTAYHYGNANYQVLARIVEAASGRPYHAFLEDSVLQVASMPSTFALDDHTPSDLAKGYARQRLLKPYDYSHAFGSGNLASTAVDLHSFAKALRQGVFGPPSEMPGWMHGTLQTHAYLEHTGHLGSGYATCFRFFKDDDLAVIVLLNTRYPDVLGLADAVSAVALDLDIMQTPASVSGAPIDSLDESVFRSSGGVCLTLQLRNGILIVRAQGGSPIYLQEIESGLYHDSEHPMYTHHLVVDEGGRVVAYEVRSWLRVQRFERVPKAYCKQ